MSSPTASSPTACWTGPDRGSGGGPGAGGRGARAARATMAASPITREAEGVARAAHTRAALVPRGAGQGRVEVVQGLFDDLADRLSGIEGGVGVLEDVLDGLEDLRPALLG